MMEEISKGLERIGLTSNEAQVYLTLLKHGTCKVGKISKISQINRTTTYDVLKRLLDKGLIGYVVKGKVKYFEVSNPNQLKDFVDEKKFEVIKLLPSLEKIYKTPEEKHNVTLYYGYHGVKSIFEDFLRNTKVHYLMDSEGKFSERMPYFAKHFVRQLEKKKIKIKHLVREGRDVHQSKTTEVRYIKKKIASEAVFDIYNDKVAIIIWTDPPEGVVIQNKAVADSLKEYFDILWKHSSKI
ncbi:MAG: MarR family transcriptional regulator [Candidatus Aenigmarchaeota archaeon]|nr:MarR family transcriptional regulator [Candidatus Aenigmarchaeota archaeon]